MTSRLGVSALVATAGLWAGCSCQPTLPPPPDNPEDTSTDTSVEDTAPTDTGPAPPCAVPELEPNDAVATATLLPMETVGCGTWAAPGDLDYFGFDLVEESWIEVQVTSARLGSVADAHLVVQAADGSAATRVDNEDGPDASLVFPATPQHFNVQISEENNQGDADRFFYEVIASVRKAPVEWTRAEVEPNDDATTASVMADGDAVFGDMSSTAENDWFSIPVPAGKHTITIDIDAYEFGSAGDFAFVLYDAALDPLPLGCVDTDCIVTGPPTGFARDPYLEWDSLGNEVLYVRVYEELGKSGDAVWYAVRVGVEG